MLRVEFISDHLVVASKTMAAGLSDLERGFNVAITPAVPPEFRGKIDGIIIKLESK
jgi:hypothetical protein